MRLFTLILCACLTFFICVSSFAQKSKSSLLWEISGNGIEEPSYLFGTIHVICPDDFVMYQEVVDAVAHSDRVLMELDMDDPQMMAKMQKLSLRTDQKDIRDMVSEEEYEMLNDFMKAKANLDMSQAGILKPMVLMSVIMMKMMPCEIITSYENEIATMAVQAEKEVSGLETVEEQMGFFDQISTEDQLQWVIDIVKDTTKFKDDFVELSDVYKTSDINKINDYMLKFPEYMEYSDLLLVERNKNWIPVIHEYVKEAPTFIAVGAGHLGSESGLVDLLKEEGYQLKPVTLHEQD